MCLSTQVYTHKQLHAESVYLGKPTQERFPHWDWSLLYGTLIHEGVAPSWDKKNADSLFWGIRNMDRGRRKQGSGTGKKDIVYTSDWMGFYTYWLVPGQVPPWAGVAETGRWEAPRAPIFGVRRKGDATLIALPILVVDEEGQGEPSSGK